MAWHSLLLTARNTLEHEDRESRPLAFVQDSKTLAETATSLFGDPTNIDTRVEGAENLLKLVIVIGLPELAADMRVQYVVELAEGAMSYIDARRNRLLKRETERIEHQDVLADLPDEKVIRRLDKDRWTIEKSALRRIQIIKGLRELGMDSGPGENLGFVSPREIEPDRLGPNGDHDE